MKLKLRLTTFRKSVAGTKLQSASRRNEETVTVWSRAEGAISAQREFPAEIQPLRRRVARFDETLAIGYSDAVILFNMTSINYI